MCLDGDEEDEEEEADEGTILHIFQYCSPVCTGWECPDMVFFNEVR